MNKAVLLFGILIVLAILFYFNNSVNQNNTASLSEESVQPSLESSPSAVSKISVPEGAYFYRISEDSTVSYKALKKFISKPEGHVVGTSDQVTGDGWFNPQNKTGFVQATINISTLKTDSDKRDKDVAEMFSDQNVRFSADISNENINLNQDFEVDVPGQLTFNGGTKEVTFRVSGNISESELSAEGKTTIKMSEFGLNPPSLVNVFTADDHLDLNFDIKALRAN